MTAAWTCDLLRYQDADGRVCVVDTPEQWQARCQDLRARMEQVMGPFPETPPPPLDFRVESDQSFEGYTRKTVSFAVESWDRLPAYLLLPDQCDTPAPAVLALHPTSSHGKGAVMGTAEPYYRNYAVELVRRGYVVLAPDYPGFGDYVSCRKQLYEQGYASCSMKGIWNHMRAVDLLQSLPEVDPKRIACIGHSLGGHNTLFLGVFDERVRVLITSCGFTRFGRYMQGDLTGWSHDGYMPRIKSVYHCSPDEMPFDFPEILAALAPRPLFICAPLRDANFDVTGVVDCVRAADPVYALYRAGDRLLAQYPEAEHDFPEATREAAYTFLGRRLR